MTEPTSLIEAQETLQRAIEDRLEVAKRRTWTEARRRRLNALLAENHFADRIRRSLT